MRHFPPTSLALALVFVALAGAAGLATAGAATGTETGKAKTHALSPVRRNTMWSRPPRSIAAVAGYRQLTWTYDRIAHLRRVRVDASPQARRRDAARRAGALEAPGRHRPPCGTRDPAPHDRSSSAGRPGPARVAGTPARVQQASRARARADLPGARAGEPVARPARARPPRPSPSGSRARRRPLSASPATPRGPCSRATGCSTN